MSPAPSTGAPGGRRSIRPPSRAAVLVEGLTALEPARLALRSATLARQPRGDGRVVLVLPGFAATDVSTIPLRSYLRGLGYDARGWGLGQNGGDVVGLVGQLRETVAELAARHGRKVPLVGWSLGGVISREIAREVPDAVEQVITFGSPVVGGPKYTRVGDVYRARGEDLDAIADAIEQRDRATPIRVPVTAMYTKADGIVAWQACIDRVTPGARNVEVRTTHLGLGLHHRVFVEVAQQLHRHRPGRR